MKIHIEKSLFEDRIPVIRIIIFYVKQFYYLSYDASPNKYLYSIFSFLEYACTRIKQAALYRDSK